MQSLKFHRCICLTRANERIIITGRNRPPPVFHWNLRNYGRTTGFCQKLQRISLQIGRNESRATGRRLWILLARARSWHQVNPRRKTTCPKKNAICRARGEVRANFLLAAGDILPGASVRGFERPPGTPGRGQTPENATIWPFVLTAASGVV